MTLRGAGPSRAWRWLALLAAFALLTPASDGLVMEAPMSRDAPTLRAADCGGCAVAWSERRDGAGVHALGHCSACHAPEARSDASSPTLARWNVVRERLAVHAPWQAPDDGVQVRAGGGVYRRACTHCHQSDRHAAPGHAPRPRPVSIDDGASREPGGAWALDAPLSDEQSAALAAFLRRHADTPPWPDGARTVPDVRL